MAFASEPLTGTNGVPCTARWSVKIKNVKKKLLVKDQIPSIAHLIVEVEVNS
jgi:hypothetical protein